MSRMPTRKIYLKREGTSQSERFPVALDPGYVEIEDRGIKNWVDYLHEFSSLLNYYNEKGLLEGNWQPFLVTLKEYLEGKAEIPEGHMPPHQSLLIAFLRLLEEHRKQLNRLTARHLDTYFGSILGVKKRDPVPDQVHVTFELKKNAPETLLRSGTLLKAGKDSSGKELLYALKEDIVVNHAEVEKMSSLLYMEDDDGLLHRADQSDSSDGEGGALPEGDQTWPPFGTKAFKVAKPGFALASPILWLQEGKRKIDVEIRLNGKLASEDLTHALNIWLTGSEGWMGPYPVTPDITELRGGMSMLGFTLELSGSDDAVTFYNPDLHEENWEVLSPMMKVYLNTGVTPGLFAELQKVGMKDISIGVEVKGMKDLSLENDKGKLDSSKPFMPFGSEPAKGSSFYIGCEEAFNKNLDHFTLRADWQDVPASNMGSYYSSSYSAESGLNYSLGEDAFRAKMVFRKRSGEISSREVGLFNGSNNKSAAEYKVIHSLVITNFLPLAHVQVSLRSFSTRKLTPVFSRKISRLPKLSLALQIKKAMAVFRPQELRAGYVKIELLHDFLHKQYRNLYTRAVAQFSVTGEGDLHLPVEPYFPVMRSITLDYRASTSRVSFLSSSEIDHTDREIELHQVGPFGHREVHSYLTSRLDHSASGLHTLVPVFDNEGELYIGLKNVSGGDGVSLLVEVAEGSADPLLDKEEVTWSVLNHDRWQELDSDHLLADHTDGLLKSGIVKIILPQGVDVNNSWLDRGLAWLRASIRKNHGAVCRVAGIHPGAAYAVFLDQGNAPDHLSTPLPAKSIGKLKIPADTIKKVTQPYASFGGRSKEDKRSYYTRVSERLRHKNRAVTVFDYERLVLEAFPSVYKVKCLPHASPTSDMAPGHTTLILVPDLQNRHATNILQPRVSKATLGEAEKYLSKYKSNFAEVHASNPEYEQIRLDLKVKFYKKYEFGFYQARLNQALINFLSPWAGSSISNIEFQGQLSKSLVVRFIEELEYVDFVVDVKMYHLVGTAQERNRDHNLVSASSQRAILTSHPHHVIKPYVS